jgi:hypothetical protein
MGEDSLAANGLLRLSRDCAGTRPTAGGRGCKGVRRCSLQGDRRSTPSVEHTAPFVDHRLTQVPAGEEVAINAVDTR